MKNLAIGFALIAFFAVQVQAKSISGKELHTNKQIEVSSGEKGLVLAFLSAKCPCSNSHVGELNDLSSQYQEIKFVAVHSNANEPEEMVEEYFKKASLKFPVLKDDNLKLANKFSAQKTPHVFVMDQAGKIVYEGAVSNNKDFAKADRKFLREALEDVTKGREVRTSSGSTLGCAISRDKKG